MRILNRRTNWNIVTLLVLLSMLTAAFQQAPPTASAAPAAAPVAAVAVPAGFVEEMVTSVPAPTALAHTPDGRMLITAQSGQLRVFKNGVLLATPALNLANVGGVNKICANGERGLLGLAIDPAFVSNGWVYLYYTHNKPNVGCVNRVSRFKMTGDAINPTSEFIMVTNQPAPASNHNAGDLNFGKDGMLYISVGDGGCDYANNSGCAGANDASRDKDVLFGKILRITRDGAIPADNPWVGTDSGRCNVNGTTTAAKCREMFAWGLRNPFRFAFSPNHTATTFHINDVGQNEWEEIDLSRKGADYGWNRCEGRYYTGTSNNCDNENPGMTDPIFNYSHGTACESITGGAFAPNGVWPSGYNSSYLYSDFVCGRIYKLSVSNGQYVSTVFASGLGDGSAVHMRFGPYASTQALYYTTYENGGQIRRIRYVGQDNRPPTASMTARPASGLVPLPVNFDASASRDPDGGALTYEWDFNEDGRIDATGAKVSHTYLTPNIYDARVFVRDARGSVAVATRRIHAGNTAPSPQIAAPTASKLFRVGEQITLQGSATDAQDGSIPTSRLSWQVLLHHSTHAHPFLGPQSGDNIQFTAPAPEDLAAAGNSYLEIRLTATDSAGLSRTISQRLNPRKATLKFATKIGVDAASLNLVVQGVQYATPKQVVSWDGYSIPLNAPDQSGRVWSSWSDGGARAHTITTPASAQTDTATYR